MGDGIDAAREPADHGHLVGGKPARHFLSHLPAVHAHATRADDGDRPLVGGRERAADEQNGRPVEDLLQLPRVARIVPGDRGDAVPVEQLELVVRVQAAARRHERGHGARIEAGGFQLRRSRRPCVFETAEVGLQLRHADTPYAGHARQRDPVLTFYFVHEARVSQSRRTKGRGVMGHRGR